MDELARRAGVTKPVVYELFGSKDGLFRACLERSAERLANVVAEAVRAESEPEARVRAGGLAFLRFAADNRVAWELMMEGASRTPRSRCGAARPRSCTSCCSRGACGRRPARARARRARGQLRLRGVAHWMWEHPDVPLERLADWTVELLLPGLRRFT